MKIRRLLLWVSAACLLVLLACKPDDGGASSPDTGSENGSGGQADGGEAGGESNGDTDPSEGDPRVWQYGLQLNDEVSGLAVDSLGNILLVGNTSRGSTFEPATETGSNDLRTHGLIVKYNPSSRQMLWAARVYPDDPVAEDANLTRLKIEQSTELYGVTVDEDGNSYFTGTSGGKLTNEELPDGLYLACVGQYDTEGNLVWIHQFGTSPNSLSKTSIGYGSEGHDIALDPSGDLIVVGETTGGPLPGLPETARGAFVAKFSKSGESLWAHQFGSEMNGGGFASSVATDMAGDIYVAGENLAEATDSQSIFLAKLSRDGDLLWLTQPDLGSEGAWSGASAVAASLDGESVYFGGGTPNDLEQEGMPYLGLENGTQAFLVRLNREGEWVWARNLPNGSGISDISLSDSGITAVGSSNGRLFVTGITEDGESVWEETYGDGSAIILSGESIASHSDGSYFIAGNVTAGRFGQPTGGPLLVYDWFVAKLNPETGRLR